MFALIIATFVQPTKNSGSEVTVLPGALYGVSVMNSADQPLTCTIGDLRESTTKPSNVIVASCSYSGFLKPDNEVKIKLVPLGAKGQTYLVATAFCGKNILSGLPPGKDKSWSKNWEIQGTDAFQEYNSRNSDYLEILAWKRNPTDKEFEAMTLMKGYGYFTVSVFKKGPPSSALEQYLITLKP